MVLEIYLFYPGWFGGNLLYPKWLKTYFKSCFLEKCSAQVAPYIWQQLSLTLSTLVRKSGQR